METKPGAVIMAWYKSYQDSFIFLSQRWHNRNWRAWKRLRMIRSMKMLLILRRLTLRRRWI